MLLRGCSLSVTQTSFYRVIGCATPKLESVFGVGSRACLTPRGGLNFRVYRDAPHVFTFPLHIAFRSFNKLVTDLSSADHTRQLRSSRVSWSYSGASWARHRRLNEGCTSLSGDSGADRPGRHTGGRAGRGTDRSRHRNRAG